MKKRLIPFNFTLEGLRLVGKERDRAEARYYLEGYDLERRLIEINMADDPTQMKKDLLRLDLDAGKIDAYEGEKQLLLLGYPDEGEERDLALLHLDHRHGKVDEITFEKQKADLVHEPWVGVVKGSFDVNKGLNGLSVEFDWNDMFIDYLRLSGYSGATQEDMVEQWFRDLCLAEITQEEIDEFGFRIISRPAPPNT
jgi:hypothetical protein